jgi:hypothetical protein
VRVRVDGFSKIIARFFPCSVGARVPRWRSALSSAARARIASRSGAISDIETRWPVAGEGIIFGASASAG